MTPINDIFSIPERVHQGDFVLKLTEGVVHPEATLGSYVVTPQLAKCFEQAMSLVKSGLDANTSKGAYLHGSFGSGKSHFMAVLTLLLQNNPAARSVPELAGVVSQSNAWTEGRKFLVVPYHMIGARSLEAGILDQYAKYVAKVHPDAPTPGFYLADALFRDAQALRAHGRRGLLCRLGIGRGLRLGQPGFVGCGDLRCRPQRSGHFGRSDAPGRQAGGCLLPAGQGSCEPHGRGLRLPGRRPLHHVQACAVPGLRHGHSLPRRAHPVAREPCLGHRLREPRGPEGRETGGGPVLGAPHPHRQLHRAPA